jgi:hypothetical protein
VIVIVRKSLLMLYGELPVVVPRYPTPVMWQAVVSEIVTLYVVIAVAEIELNVAR